MGVEEGSEGGGGGGDGGDCGAGDSRGGGEGGRGGGGGAGRGGAEQPERKAQRGGQDPGRHQPSGLWAPVMGMRHLTLWSGRGGVSPRALAASHRCFNDEFELRADGGGSFFVPTGTVNPI